MKQIMICEHTCGSTTCFSIGDAKMCEFVIQNAHGKYTCAVLNERLKEDKKIDYCVDHNV